MVPQFSLSAVTTTKAIALFIEGVKVVAVLFMFENVPFGDTQEIAFALPPSIAFKSIDPPLQTLTLFDVVIVGGPSFSISKF